MQRKRDSINVPLNISLKKEKKMKIFCRNAKIALQLQE